VANAGVGKRLALAVGDLPDSLDRSKGLSYYASQPSLCLVAVPEVSGVSKTCRRLCVVCRIG